MNLSMENCVVSNATKFAKVTPIYKNGDTQDIWKLLKGSYTIVLTLFSINIVF